MVLLMEFLRGRLKQKEISGLFPINVGAAQLPNEQFLLMAGPKWFTKMKRSGNESDDDYMSAAYLTQETEQEITYTKQRLKKLREQESK